VMVNDLCGRLGGAVTSDGRHLGTSLLASCLQYN
jgi:hypothetical protein